MSSVECDAASGFAQLPTELGLRCFALLHKPDLAQAARVSRAWHGLAQDPSLPQNRTVAAIVLPAFCEASLKTVPRATTLEALCRALRAPRHAELEELDLSLLVTSYVHGRGPRVEALRAALAAAGPQLRRLRYRVFASELDVLTEAAEVDMGVGREEAAAVAALCPRIEALAVAMPHSLLLAGAPSLPCLVELHCDFVAKPQPLARLLSAYPRLRALGSARIYAGCELPWTRRAGLRVHRLEIGELPPDLHEPVLASIPASGVDEICVMAASVRAEELAGRWLPRVGRHLRALDLDSITFGGCSEAVRRECPALELAQLRFSKQGLVASEYLGHAQAVLEEAAALGPRLTALSLADLPYMRLASLLGALGRAGEGAAPAPPFIRAHRSSLYDDEVKALPGYGRHRPFRWMLEPGVGGEAEARTST
eukprot:tig00000743_g3879.t1